MDVPVLDAYRTWLENMGYRFTSQRQAVLEQVIALRGRHFTCDDVYMRLKESGGIGQATVYRTMPLLEAAGIVRQTRLDSDVVHYELVDPAEKHAHHHLICTRCGSVAEVDDLLETLEKQIEQRHGFEVHNHDAQFFGICARCRSLP